MNGDRNFGFQTDLWCGSDRPSVINSIQKSYLGAIDVHADSGFALHPGRHMLHTEADYFAQIALEVQKVKENGHQYSCFWVTARACAISITLDQD